MMMIPASAGMTVTKTVPERRCEANGRSRQRSLAKAPFDRLTALSEVEGQSRKGPQRN